MLGNAAVHCQYESTTGIYKFWKG